MQLLDKDKNVYWAVAEARPDFSHKFGRTWDRATKSIDGVNVEMWYDTTWGSNYHFEWAGRWYRLQLFNNPRDDTLGVQDIYELFTRKG